MNQQLLNYIKQNLEEGKKKEEIWQELKKAGWPEESLKRVFEELGLVEMELLPGVEDLLERTFQFYKERFWTLVGIMAIPALIGLIWGLLLVHIKLEPDLGIIFSLIVFFILSIIVFLWAEVALLLAIKNREIGIKKAFARSWSKIISYFWISLLSIFLVLGGFLLFLVPGIIMGIWFSLAFYVFIDEEKRGMNALFRSKQLVAGNWGKVFWRLLLAFLMIMFANFTISLIPFLGEALAGLLTTPFGFTFGFLLCRDLKQLKKDPLFEPPKTAAKLKFIILAVIGYLLPITVIAGLVFW